MIDFLSLGLVGCLVLSLQSVDFIIPANKESFPFGKLSWLLITISVSLGIEI